MRPNQYSIEPQVHPHLGASKYTCNQASGNDLFKVLASKLLHNQSHLFVISLNSDRAVKGPCNTDALDL